MKKSVKALLNNNPPFLCLSNFSYSPIFIITQIMYFTKNSMTQVLEWGAIAFSKKRKQKEAITIKLHTAEKKVVLTLEFIAVLCLDAQSCPTLCDPTDCSPQGSSVHDDSPGQNTGVGNLSLLQGIFLTQELNPGLLHCRSIRYHLSYQGTLRI